MNRSTARIHLLDSGVRPTRRLRRSRASAMCAFLAALVIASLLGASTGSGTRVSAQDAEFQSSATAAAEWLLEQRLEDGAFPGFTGEADPGLTVDAIIALSAAGKADEIEQSLAYLESEALVFAQTGPGSAAKLALALVAAGLDPHDFATVDPLSIVEHAAAQGLIGFGPYDHALGLLALAAGGSEIPDQAIEAVFTTQGEDGGWKFDGSTAPGTGDTNTTALMIQAAYAAGIGNDDRIAAAIDWLFSLQAEDGGVPYLPDDPSDSNSTALAAQALMAAGRGTDDPDVSALLETLAAFQNDNGSISWLIDPRDENIFSTVNAIPAMAGVALPVYADAESAQVVFRIAA